MADDFDSEQARSEDRGLEATDARVHVSDVWTMAQHRQQACQKEIDAEGRRDGHPEDEFKRIWLRIPRK